MNENEKKQSNSKTLSLRGGGGSSVRMNLSHGRSKSVLIETKRKKIIFTNKNNPSQNQKEKNAFNLEDSNKTNEKVFSEEQIDRRKKAIEAAREREILIKEERARSSFIRISLSLAASIAFFLLSICSSEKTFSFVLLLSSRLKAFFSFWFWDGLFLLVKIIFFLFVSIKTDFDLP